jgi:hypothetical protein
MDFPEVEGWSCVDAAEAEAAVSVATTRQSGKACCASFVSFSFSEADDAEAPAPSVVAAADAELYVMKRTRMMSRMQCVCSLSVLQHCRCCTRP